MQTQEVLTDLTHDEQLTAFGKLLEAEKIEYLRKSKLDCQANIDNAKVTIKPGNKYSKVDVGSSGKYMVDKEGNIFGIKAYGQIHKGHHYGTLTTTNEWNWGGYTARKKA